MPSQLEMTARKTLYHHHNFPELEKLSEWVGRVPRLEKREVVMMNGTRPHGRDVCKKGLRFNLIMLDMTPYFLGPSS